jgi:hypothetical protein
LFLQDFARGSSAHTLLNNTLGVEEGLCAILSTLNLLLLRRDNHTKYHNKIQFPDGGKTISKKQLSNHDKKLQDPGMQKKLQQQIKLRKSGSAPFARPKQKKYT